MALIFATSCTFIERRVFIQFVGHYLPSGVTRQVWITFWGAFGLGVVKAYHVTEYALLCVLLFRGLRSRFKFSSALFAAAALCLAFAASDEWHQTFVPGRGGTWVDVTIDALGIGLACGFILRRQRRAAQARPLAGV